MDPDILGNVTVCLPLSWQEGKFGLRIAQSLVERGAQVFAFAASSAEAMDFAAKVNKIANRQPGVVGLRCDQLKSLNVKYDAVITDGSFYIPDGDFTSGNKGGLFNNLERLIKVEKDNRKLCDENARLRRNIFDMQQKLDTTLDARHSRPNDEDSRVKYAEEVERLQQENLAWEEKCRRLRDVVLLEESEKMDRAIVDAKDAQARKRQVEHILKTPAALGIDLGFSDFARPDTVTTIKEELSPENRKDPEQAPEGPEEPNKKPVFVQAPQQDRQSKQGNVLWARLPFNCASRVPTGVRTSAPNPRARQSPMATPRGAFKPKSSPILQNRVVRSISCSADPVDVVRSVSSVSVNCAPNQNPRYQISPFVCNRDVVAMSYHGSWAALPQDRSADATGNTQQNTFSTSPRLLQVKLPMFPWARNA